MSASVNHWLMASYRANEPRVAQDELPGIGSQSRHPQADGAVAEAFRCRRPEAGRLFRDRRREAIIDRAEEHLEGSGSHRRIQMTPAQRDILQATIEPNVELIKSIPAQYLTQVQGSVMRSVQTGRDLGTLAKELQEHYGVTKRRAAFIARSQNNLATASMTRARQTELGITEAIWTHSGGGKHPRPSHLAAGRSKTKYDVKTGWYDPDAGKNIWPGELPNCRCVARAVVKETVSVSEPV